MVARTPREIALHVVQRVIHPTHVPLEVETQAAVFGGVGDERPGGRLLGDHHDVGEFPAHRAVDLADEGGGVEVLLGAVLVELFVCWVVHAEVEVQHARDAVHADAVHMEVLNPEQDIGHQEAADLGAAEIELVSAPVGMDLSLEEHVPVEGGEALRVGAEAAGDPVEDHADARLVAAVDEVHELLRRAVARRGGEVSGRLIAPRPVEGMLHEGHDLDVRVAHLLDVRHQLIGEVVVRVVGAALGGERIAGARPGAIFARLSLRFVSVALPGAQMHLVDVEGALHDVALRAATQPGSILPGVAGDVP